MEVNLGSQSISLTVLVTDELGVGQEGLDATTFPTTYWTLGGGIENQIALTDLDDLTDAFTEGGLFEKSKGRYRLDFPNACWVELGHLYTYGEDNDKYLHVESIDIKSGTGLLGSNADILNVIVTDADTSDPIINARALLYSGDILLATATTNINGAAELIYYPGEDYSLYVHATGYSGIRRLVDLPGDEEVTLEPLSINPAPELNQTSAYTYGYNSTGALAAGIKAYFKLIEPIGVAGVWSRETLVATSDADGLITQVLPTDSRVMIAGNPEFTNGKVFKTGLGGTFQIPVEIK